MTTKPFSAADALKVVATAKKTISVLGATGSVGQSTLDLVRNVNKTASGSPADGPYKIEVLTAQQRVEDLIGICREFVPSVAVIGNEEKLSDLQEGLSDLPIEVAAGRSALLETASRKVDWLMAAIVGAAGLAPTLEAVRQGTTVALANKECLVCAGDLFLQEVRKSGAELLPVDSEHNAIFQVFDFEAPETVEKVTLTASGGPFREFSRDEMKQVTPKQAVAHPNWDMGAKISVDSATMMNKGLELIEAFHLFPVSEEQLDVVIHPQSVIHSYVRYRDGSVLAQMGSPDMRTPIAYTLAWPDRMDAQVHPLDLTAVGTLTFEKPDDIRFPALKVARDALAHGASAPTILNASNEVAVQLFLREKIGFLDIVKVVQATLDAVLHSDVDGIGDRSPSTLEEVYNLDERSRLKAEQIAAEICG